MLIGFVSDEMHVALSDVLFEFSKGSEVLEARSSASGAVRAELSAGVWQAVVTKLNFGRKTIQIEVKLGMSLIQMRLMSDRLLGYAWPKWAQAGDTVELRVHSPEPYFASLWRYGYDKVHVADIGRFESFGPGGDCQVLPDCDFTVTGVQWNHYGRRFPPSARAYITTPFKSGLYYVHLEGERTQSFFNFPLIVAPRDPAANIAVLASNINWNAYNDFGGRSNYVGAARLNLEPVVNPHQDGAFLRDTGARFWDRDDYDPISFDRPEPVNRVAREAKVTDIMDRIGEEHVAPATWRLLGWLEREGFSYDLWSETQLHTNTLQLDRYKVLVLDQHPEYWSKKMYYALKSWVFERGGRLIYLGGNGLNCEVEFVNDSSVIHRNTDLSEWLPTRSSEGGPGSAVPSRMGKRVENEACLLGVSTTMTGMGTGAPFKVVDSDHWCYSGTGLQVGDLFGHESLDARNPGGASGHETDKINNFSPSGIRLLAKGTNPFGGGSEMVSFETQAGGEVFSTGSISWICSLLVSDKISRITANVLHRFTR